MRNLHHDRVDFGAGINWVVGPNGQGKTNLLEAAYVLLTSRSFRSAHLKEIIGDGANAAGLEGGAEIDGQQRLLRVEIDKHRTRRLLEGKVCGTIEYVALSKAIAFTRHSLNLVDGSPEFRRRFLDRLVTFLDRQQLVRLSQYRRFRQQLARSLSKGHDLSVFRSFKEGWIGISQSLVAERKRHLEALRPKVQRIFAEWFPHGSELQIEYRIRGVKEHHDYAERLRELAAQEALQKRMLAGAHLDDLDILLGGVPARQVASAGQIRAIALALTLATAELVYEQTGVQPVLVLDDLDAELDEARIFRVLEYVDRGGQTLVSTTKYGIIREFGKGTVFRVDSGTVHLERDRE